MFIFTFDIDWAPEKVIEDVLSLLDDYNIRGTFFATHQSSVLKKLEREGKHEIGIHPNFNPLLLGQTGHYQNKIDELLEMYPMSVGFRAHSLAHSCPMLIYCLEKGIKYDSNIYMPFVKDITPFNYFGLIRIPYNWEDDGQWVAGKTFDDSGLDSKAKLNVLDFHPIHIYLNTADQNMYDQVRHLYQFPDELIKVRNTKIPGTRDLFLSLLKMCKREEIEVSTMKEYYGNICTDPLFRTLL